MTKKLMPLKDCPFCGKQPAVKFDCIGPERKECVMAVMCENHHCEVNPKTFGPLSLEAWQSRPSSGAGLTVAEIKHELRMSMGVKHGLNTQEHTYPRYVYFEKGHSWDQILEDAAQAIHARLNHKGAA